jgi:hypothetical protein
MRPTFAALIAATMLTMLPARAQNAAAPAAPPPPASAAQPPDFPGLGEVMTLQQLRHIKLWFAGRSGNWPLADYELGELQEGFEDADKLVGGGTVDKMVGAAMKTLQKVVADKDRAAFPAAFDNLSAGCNSCHHFLGRPFIAIQRPTSLPYSDQSFTPKK